MGRASLYETHVLPRLAEIVKWYADENEGTIIRRLGVSRSAWESYKRDHPELRECLRKGKQELVEELRDSLKKKAKGFRYRETKKTIREENGKITTTVEEFDRYSPPDTGAIHLLLKNLDDTWRNDDKATMDLRKEKLDVERGKQW